jgi:hypothetical protein
MRFNFWNYFLLFISFIYVIVGCSNSDNSAENYEVGNTTQVIDVHLYCNSPLSNGNKYSTEVKNLLKPKLCKGDTNYLFQVFLHRLDINKSSKEPLSVQLRGLNALRQKAGTVSFTHYMQEFKMNSGDWKPTALMLEDDLNDGNSNVSLGAKLNENHESGQPILVSSNLVEIDVPGDLYVFNNPDSLWSFYDRNVCDLMLNSNTIHVVLKRNEEGSRLSVTEKPSINAGGSSKMNTEFILENYLNEIGNRNISPEERREMISNIPNVQFTEDAVVKEIMSNGTVVGIPKEVNEYFERIAMFRSLDSIRVDSIMQNDEGEIWELHVKEYHQHM